MFGAENPPTQSVVHALAVVVMLAILGGVVMLQRFAKLEAETQGPGLVAVGADGDTLLAARDELFLVREGRPVERIALAALGLGGPVVALGWDGRSWFVGDDATGSLHRCDLEARRCADALQPGGERWLRRTAKVAFAPDRIYLTDTERHRLLAFDAAGQPLGASRTAPVALCFPNGLVAWDGGLLVADTNNHRIAWVDPTDGFASESYLNVSGSPDVTSPQCSDISTALGEGSDPALNLALDSAMARGARTIDGARPGRVFPTAVVPVGEPERATLWVIAAADGMKDGDVLVFRPDADEPIRVPLPDDSDPVGLAARGDQMLIADPTRMRVYAVDTAKSVASFDDWRPAGLPEALAEQRDARARHHLFALVSKALIGLGVLLALVVVYLEQLRKTAQGAA
jgi:hypothetical protein